MYIFPSNLSCGLLLLAEVQIHNVDRFESDFQYELIGYLRLHASIYDDYEGKKRVVPLNQVPQYLICNVTEFPFVDKLKEMGFTSLFNFNNHLSDNDNFMFLLDVLAYIKKHFTIDAEGIIR
jgi:hypothetical protein